MKRILHSEFRKRFFFFLKSEIVLVFFIVGITTTSKGQSNSYVLNFDGIDDYVEVPSSEQLKIYGDLTLETWARYDVLGSGNKTQLIIQGGIGENSGENEVNNIIYSLGIKNDMHLECFMERLNGTNIYETGTSTPVHSSEPAPISAGVWHHYALVRNGTTKEITFYIDGKQLGTTKSYEYAPTGSSTSPLFIGSETTNADGSAVYPFNGEMDELRVWNVARSQAEIQASMNSSLASPATEPNLVAYYTFDDISGATLPDNSSNSNNGTLNFTPTESNPSNPLNFDGIDDYIEANSVSATISDSTALTMEAWIYPENTTNQRFILTFHQNDYNNRILFGIKNGVLALGYNNSGDFTKYGTTQIPLNTWTHIAFSLDNSENAIAYINGQEEFTFTIPVWPDLNGRFSIGQDFDDTNITDVFDGDIDEVRVWSAVRSQLQIQQNMATELSGNENNLLAYYTFDDISGTTLPDNSTNSNDGTLINFAPTDISLTPSTMAENQPAGTTVGTLSSSPDFGNYSYSFVSGDGDTDNASFSLEVNEEEQISGSEYTSGIGIMAGQTYWQSFTATGTGLLSRIMIRTTAGGALVETGHTMKYKIYEGEGIEGEFLGEVTSELVIENGFLTCNFNGITVTAGEKYTFQLTDWTFANYTFPGLIVLDTEYSGGKLYYYNLPGYDLLFKTYIVNSIELVTKSSFNYESKSSYSTRIKSTNEVGDTYEEIITINVSNVNETPQGITLSSNTINENVAANSIVGDFSTSDPDAANTFTYTLVSGTGSTDNSSFNISGNSLRITNSPDYETKNSYSIRIRTTDQGNLSFEKVFAITINDLNESPLATAPLAPTVSEDDTNVAIANDIQISDEDGDNQTVTFTITGGTLRIGTSGISFGGNGNGSSSFTASGTLSVINTALDAATFTPTANLNGTNAGTIAFTSNDGTDDSNNTLVSFDIIAVNDDPTINILPSDITVTEDLATNVDLSAATFADIDAASSNVTLALVVSAGTLSATSGGGVTLSGSGTGNLTLIGTESNIDTYLNTASNIQYTSAPNDNGNNAATLTLTANDGGNTGTGGGTDVALGTVNINITGVNDAPVFANLDATPAYTESNSEIQLDANVTISDVDLDALNGGNGNYAGAVLTIVRNGGANSSDNFSVNSGGNLTVAGGPAGGGTISAGGNVIASIANTGSGQIQITFASNGTIPTTALVNEVMRAIRYTNSSDDPDSSVQLNWTFSDGNSGNAQGTGDNPGTDTGSTTVTITGVNDEPTLTATGQDPTFVEGGSSAELFSVDTVSTVENGQTLKGLTLTISNLGDGASEILHIDGSDVALTNGNSVTTSTNSLKVTVTVVGTAATVAISGASFTETQFKTFLNGLAYTNTSDNPATTKRVTITSLQDNGGTANGGDDTYSLNVTSTVSITPVNDPPMVGGVFGDNSSEVTAGAGAQNLIGLDDATVSNADSKSYSGGFLTISQTSGTTNGSWSTDGTNITSGGDGTISAGETIAVGGVSIGTVDATNDGQGGNNLQISFYGSSNNERIQTLIQNLNYSAPSGLGSRTFTLTLNDGEGTANSGDDEVSGSFQIEITPNPPVLNNIDSDNATAMVGGPSVFIDVDRNSTVTDADSPNFNGGNITLIQNSGEENGNLSLDGTTAISGADGTIEAEESIKIGSVVIGTVHGTNDGQSGNSLEITFNSEATPARVQDLLRSLKYYSPSVTGDRTFTLTLTDASTNSASTSADITVTMTLPELQCNPEDIYLGEDGTYILSSFEIKTMAFGTTESFNDLTVNISRLGFNCSQVGEDLQAKVMVTDQAGNESFCWADITVHYPTIYKVAPIDDIIAEAGQGECGTSITYPDLLNDACATFTQIAGLGTDTIFPIGTTTESWEMTDMNGNKDTLSFDVIVTAVNAVPTLDAINSVQAGEDEEIEVKLTGISYGNDCDAQEVLINAETTNTQLVESASVEYTSGDSTAILKIYLVPEATGSAEFTVTVEDELGASTSETFAIQISSRNDAPFVVTPLLDQIVNTSYILKVPVSSVLGEVFDDIDSDSITLEIVEEGTDTLPGWAGFSLDTLFCEPMIADTGCVNLIVKAFDNEGAMGTDTFSICVDGYSTAIEDLKFENLEVQMYPNPSKGKVTLDFSSNIYNVDLEVMDITGKVVLRKELPSIQQATFDMSDRVSGLYFVHLNFNGAHVIKKLIVDRK